MVVVLGVIVVVGVEGAGLVGVVAVVDSTDTSMTSEGGAAFFGAFVFRMGGKFSSSDASPFDCTRPSRTAISCSSIL